MIELVFLWMVASPEPDAFCNVANRTLTALPPAKAPLRRNLKGENNPTRKAVFPKKNKKKKFA
ncbi:hypothetical protein [Pontibacter virosus]|uniref:hypothetical protein n=1 Tax=Pontibacter virosus TaxID=1765052 RepID=UPI000E308787|nr:hypothetical protein [Pontibacter virosus]